MKVKIKSGPRGEGFVLELDGKQVPTENIAVATLAFAANNEVMLSLSLYCDEIDIEAMGVIVRGDSLTEVEE